MNNHWIVSWTETDGNREQDCYATDGDLAELIGKLLAKGWFKNVTWVEFVPRVLDKDGRPDPCGGRHTWINLAGFTHCVRCGRNP
jgi:hypothetical protein